MSSTSNATQEDYITTRQFANLLKTNPSVIKASRSSGILFDRTPPPFIRLGDRKLLYKLSEVTHWINQFPTSTITTHSEPAQLSSYAQREGALS